MKILEINKFYYQKGGSENHFFGLIDVLEKNGHKVVSFSMRHPDNLNTEFDKYFIENINYNKFSLKNILKMFYNREAVRNLKKLIKIEKIEIAHLHNIAHQINPAIIKVLKNNNIPVIQTLHDYKLVCPAYSAYRDGKTCYDCKGGKYYNCLKYKCHKSSFFSSFLLMLETYWHNKILKNYDLVDVFIAPSQFMKDVCVEFGVSADKIEVIKNFSEKSEFDNLDKSKKELGFYLFYFGRISKEKGINVLLKSLARLDDEKLIIAGSGEIEDLNMEIKKLDLDNKVEFVGFKSGQDLLDLIIKAKAIVLPSVCNDNMPSSLLEAMSLGKTVIASRVGGIPEVITDKENGFLFTAGDSEDLKLKIRELKKYDLHKIEENAKNIKVHFNKNKYYQEIIKIFEKTKEKQKEM